MAHKVITPPTTEPITLAEAKAWCRVDDSTQDGIMAMLISFARDWAEDFTGKAFAEQTWETVLDYFPAGGIQLDGTVMSIESVIYVDENLDEITVAPSAYSLDNYSTSAWLLPASGDSWPSAGGVANAVRVRYKVGGTPAPAVKAAMLLLISHLNENREAVVTGVAAAQLPLGVIDLLYPHRINLGV
jgi:uncharacterized phiE125 gp8 family phage protein